MKGQTANPDSNTHTLAMRRDKVRLSKTNKQEQNKTKAKQT